MAIHGSVERKTLACAAMAAPSPTGRANAGEIYDAACPSMGVGSSSLGDPTDTTEPQSSLHQQAVYSSWGDNAAARWRAARPAVKPAQNARRSRTSGG